MKSLRMAMQIGLAGMVAGAALGQQTARMSQPQIVNGQVETRAVATNLSNTVEQIEGEGNKPLWIAYGVDWNDADLGDTYGWSLRRSADSL